ncbi:hypothetical protein JXM67_00510 [candidate division WOR-3 bacterium]|nr:hypothetical protein [candidate division WOR-3 bacterium]
MAKPFQFFTEQGIVYYSTFKADNLKSLLTGLRGVPSSSIFYHLYHSLLRRHFTTTDYMNDFAQWVWGVLWHKTLGEKLASFDPLEFTRIRDARARLIEIVDNYVGESEYFLRVPEEQAFYFLCVKSFIYPVGIKASNLHELIQALRIVSPQSLFYHLIESRLRLRKASNDLSIWLEEDMEQPELASKINAISPYEYNLEEIRNRIITLLHNAVK